MATLYIAASNSSTRDKAFANYVCDGTDDQVEINNAIGQMTTSAGGHIHLFQGEYMCGNNGTGIVSRVDSIHFTGDGIADSGTAGTIIRAHVNKTNGYLFDVDGPTALARPAAGATIKDIELMGNGATGAVGMVGLRWSSFRSEVMNILVRDFSSHGVLIYDWPSWSCYDSTFHKLDVSFCGGDGVNGGGTDTKWDNCTLHDNTGAGIRMEAAATIHENHMIYSNLGGGAVVVNGAARTHFMNCKFEQNNNGVLILGVTTAPSDFKVMGCIFETNSRVSGGAYSHIKYNSPTYGVVGHQIVGNMFGDTYYDGTSNFHVQYNIDFNNSAGNSHMIAHNIFDMAATVGVINGNYMGDPMYIQGNFGYPDYQQSTTYGTAPAIATGATLSLLGSPLAGNSAFARPDARNIRVAPTAAVTGIILPTALVGGQGIVVMNESAFLITFAAAATSKVAGSTGSNVTVPANTAKQFTWSAFKSLWYAG